MSMSSGTRSDHFEKVQFFFSSFSKPRLVVLVFLTLVQGLMEVFTVGILVPFIALISSPEKALVQPAIMRLHAWFGAPDLRIFITEFGVLIGLVALLKTFYSLSVRWLYYAFSFDAQNQLATRLFRAYLARDYAFFTGTETALLLRNILGITGSLVTGMLMPTLAILADGSVLAILFVLLIYANPVLTLLLGCGIGGALLASHLGLRKTLARMGEERTKVSGEAYRILSDALHGIKDVKILGKGSYFFSAFADISKRFSEIERKFATISAVPPLLNEVLGIFTVVAAVLYLVSRGEKIDTILPSVSFYLLAAYRLIPAASRISPSLHSIGFYGDAMEVIYRDLKAIPCSVDRRTPSSATSTPIPFTKSIRLSDITFQYPGARVPALQGVELVFRKNGSTALVGPSGSGKTTIADLLLGLYRPDAGTISVDDRPLADNDLEAWRSRIGYVPQSIFLTDRTLAENIAFGVPREKIDRLAVERAARAAQLEEVIVKLPHGLDTPIGERGVRLSGGQRQRIGIARALYHDPELIIMDEATSALDSMTENEIVNQISRISETKTLIIIAHRISTIRECDHIYLIDSGKVRGSGGYESLMKTSELFIRLATATPSASNGGA